MKYLTRPAEGPAKTLSDDPLETPPVFQTGDPQEAIKEVIRRTQGQVPGIRVSPGVSFNPLGTAEDQDPSLTGRFGVGGGELEFGVKEDEGFIGFRKQFDEGGVVEREGFRKGSDVINYEKYRKIIEQIKKDRPERIGKGGSTPLYENNKKFQKIIKELATKNIPIREAAKNLGVSHTAVERARKKLGLTKRSDLGGYDYLNDPKNIKYVRDNYGDKKQSTMAKELFPDSPETTSVRRIERIIQKHFPQKKGLAKEVKGDPTESKEKRKKRKQSVIKKLSKTSDLNLEEDLRKLKKGMGVDLAHLQRKTLPQTTSNIGMDIPASNRGAMEVVEKIISDLESTNKKFYNRYKNKKIPKDVVDKIELNNQKIIDLVYRSRGAVVGNILNEKTGKTKEFIGSYRYSADDGLFDIPMKKIAKDPEKLATFKLMALNKAREIAKLRGKTVEELYPDLLKDPKIKTRTEQILKSKNLLKPTQLYSGPAALPEMARLGGEVLTQDIPKASSVVERGLKNLRLLRPIAYETGFGAAVAPVDFLEGRPISEILLDIPTLGIAGQSLRAERLRQTVGPEVFDKIQEQRAARSEGVGGIESAMFEDFGVDETPLEEAIQARADREAEVAKTRKIQDVSEMDIVGLPKAALGGRVDFKDGGMDRRSFLKLVGGLASLPVLGRFFKFVEPATKKVLENAPTGTPDWFAPLVEKIAKEGIDISDKAAMIERQTVKELKTPDGTYTLTQTPDTGEITVSVDTLAGVNDAPVDFVMTPNRITDIAEDGKPIVDRGEFNIIEMRPTGKMVGPEDYDIDLDEFVTNNLDDVASDWHAVEEFATGKTSKPAQASRRQIKQSVEEDPLEDVLNRQGDYDPPEPELDYD